MEEYVYAYRNTGYVKSTHIANTKDLAVGIAHHRRHRSMPLDTSTRAGRGASKAPGALNVGMTVVGRVESLSMGIVMGECRSTGLKARVNGWNTSMSIRPRAGKVQKATRERTSNK